MITSYVLKKYKRLLKKLNDDGIYGIWEDVANQERMQTELEKKMLKKTAKGNHEKFIEG